MTEPIDLASARAAFEQRMAAKMRDAREAFNNAITEFFRLHVVGQNLGAAQPSADHLTAEYPPAWADAQRQGPLGERREPVDRR